MFPAALECRTSVSQFLDRDSTRTRDIGAKATLEIADSRIAGGGSGREKKTSYQAR